MRVLMIEDDECLCAIFGRLESTWRKQCHPIEFELFICRDLECGLRENVDKRPDVVLLDLALTDSASNETAQSIDLFDGDPPPAVIVLTGQERPELVLAAFRHGADSYVNKFVAMRNQDWLLATIINADMRRQHRPTYCRHAPPS